jgi:formate dehydrogenase assembly factor FdhD
VGTSSRGGTVTEAVVLRVRDGEAQPRADALATEEPMEIRAGDFVRDGGFNVYAHPERIEGRA